MAVCGVFYTAVDFHGILLSRERWAFGRPFRPHNRYDVIDVSTEFVQTEGYLD